MAQGERDVLGERPIGFTPSGVPIYPEEESIYSTYRRISQDRADNSKGEEEKEVEIQPQKFVQGRLPGMDGLALIPDSSLRQLSYTRQILRLVDGIRSVVDKFQVQPITGRATA
jgi:hypothetical protein